MTDHDKELIERVRHFAADQWNEASALAREADTEEAVRELQFLSSALYHRDEYQNGLD